MLLNFQQLQTYMDSTTAPVPFNFDPIFTSTLNEITLGTLLDECHTSAETVIDLDGTTMEYVATNQGQTEELEDTLVMPEMEDTAVVMENDSIQIVNEIEVITLNDNTTIEVIEVMDITQNTTTEAMEIYSSVDREGDQSSKQSDSTLMDYIASCPVHNHHLDNTNSSMCPDDPSCTCLK